MNPACLFSSKGSCPWRQFEVTRGASFISTGVTIVTLVVAFSLLALDVEYFWVVFIVGFAGVLPASMGVVAHHQTQTDNRPSSRDESDTALQRLQMRYVRGGITDVEFERQVDNLLESEPTESAVGVRRPDSDSNWGP